jgi:hypothetical protein
MVARSVEPVDAEVDGAVVMMSLRRGKYYGLDGVGSRIWQLLAAPIEVGALCTALEQEFDVDPDRCEADVIEFLEGLEREGLIEVRDGKAV